MQGCVPREWVIARQGYVLQTWVELVVHTLSDVPSIGRLFEVGLCVDEQINRTNYLWFLSNMGSWPSRTKAVWFYFRLILVKNTKTIKHHESWSIFQILNKIVWTCQFLQNPVKVIITQSFSQPIGFNICINYLK